MPLDTPLHAEPQAVREALAPLRNDFSVALVAPGNPFAIGGIIRVAHNFLAREIFLVATDAGYAKASMGMDKYETVVRLARVEQLAERIAGRPVWAVEKDHARRSISAIERFPPGVVFVFGSERFGLPERVLEGADEILGIPIYGVNHSLPLVVAAGIVMHEWARRRYASGAIA